MSEIIYPQIPHDEKKNVKLKYDDIEKIKYLFHIEKLAIPEIADKFNVRSKTIRYHLDPIFRKKQLEFNHRRQHELWCNDEEYRKSAIKKRVKWIKERKHLTPSYKIWKSVDSKQFRKKNTVKIENYKVNNRNNKKKYDVDYRIKNKNKRNELNKKYYLIKRNIQYGMKWF